MGLVGAQFASSCTARVNPARFRTVGQHEGPQAIDNNLVVAVLTLVVTTLGVLVMVAARGGVAAVRLGWWLGAPVYLPTPRLGSSVLTSGASTPGVDLGVGDHERPL